jgi:superfamily II DNA or RNA helicase
MKLLINGEFIEILCDSTDYENITKAMNIPYVHFNRNRTKFVTTSRNIDLVLKVFRGIDEYTTHVLPEKVRDIYDNEMIRRVNIKTLLELGKQRDCGKMHGGELTPHQQLGVEIAEVEKRYGFFYSTRTGKTIMSLKIIEEDLKKHPGHQWLILCPLILIDNAWVSDATQFFPNLKLVVLHDKTKRKRQEKFGLNADVYIGNIESFVDYKEFYDRLKIEGCFLDESSKMKSPKAAFSKAAVEYAHTLNRWYLLSGTPAPNCEVEYYTQLQSIDFYGVHQSRSQFKDHFFDNTSYNPQFEKLKMKPERKDEFMQLLRKYSLYVDREDVMETPGRDFIDYTFDMPEELAKTYKEMKSELAIEISETDVTAMSAAAAANKLNQITSGFIMDTEAYNSNKNLKTDLQEVYYLSDYRFVELERLLHSLGDKQAIIWAYYKFEFRTIKERIGSLCDCIYGDTTIEEKNKTLKAFKEGRIRYLVANPASASMGLTLTNAHIAIYFSMGYSMELFAQSADRIYGSTRSQPNRCTYYIMMAKGTIDELIYKAVQGKCKLSSEILDFLKGGL